MKRRDSSPKQPSSQCQAPLFKHGSAIRFAIQFKSSVLSMKSVNDFKRTVLNNDQRGIPCRFKINYPYERALSILDATWLSSSLSLDRNFDHFFDTPNSRHEYEIYPRKTRLGLGIKTRNVSNYDFWTSDFWASAFWTSEFSIPLRLSSDILSATLRVFGVRRSNTPPQKKKRSVFWMAHVFLVCYKKKKSS